MVLSERQLGKMELDVIQSEWREPRLGHEKGRLTKETLDVEALKAEREKKVFPPFNFVRTLPPDQKVRVFTIAMRQLGQESYWIPVEDTYK